MKIQYLNGGLANQVFQYIFIRYAELSNPLSDPWFLDDSFFFINNVHNGYELDKVFHLHPKLLSQHFDEELWNELIQNKRQGISIPQSFLNLGFPMKMISEFENYKEHNPFAGEIYHIPGNAFIPEITSIPEEFLYYHGYWLNPKWFRTYQDIFLKELSFPTLLPSDNQNTAYASRIIETRSVAVHIRRGDYVKLGWQSKNDFYLQNVKKILVEHPDAVFFVFSDDIDWCMQNRESMGLHLPSETMFVTGNTHGNNYIDLQLMSMCNIMLLGRSAFGYLAMLLNKRLIYCVFDQ